MLLAALQVSPFVFASTLCVGLVVGYLVYFYTLRTTRLVNKLPGFPCYPLVGSVPCFEMDDAKFFQQIFNISWKFGPMWRIWLSVSPLVVLNAAEAVEPILRGSHHIEKSHLYRFLLPWLGTGLLIAGGPKWKSRRRMLTHAFHFDILKDMVEVFREQATVLVAKLDKSATKQPLDVFPAISLCALDSICETAMGKQLGAQANEESEYVRAVFRISELIHHRQKFPWNWPDLVYSLLPEGREHSRCLRILHGFTESVIRERRQASQADGAAPAGDTAGDGSEPEKKRRLAFLDLLLSAKDENGDPLTDQDIREEVDTFMFEGHDTTAAAMCWALHLIGSHPEVQARLVEEIDSVLGDEDTPTFEQLKGHQLPYLEMVLKECLRLYPSVPAISRELDADVRLCGYDIPKDATIIVLTFMVHRDPNHWPEPETFNPERFSTENSKNRHPYAFIPFSAGPRNCIGQKFAEFEEKVIISAILKKFKVTSMQQEAELKPLGELILRPERGIIVTLERR